MADLTERTARLICNFDGAAVPAEAIHRSKVGVLDCVGVALAGSREPVGKIMLEGYIIGLEVMAKLGRIFGPQAYERSWHPTAVLGVMGACASMSYLLRLSYEQTLNAIGIAASEASGIKKNFGSMTKPLHAGSAARKGLWAALLAEKGLTADAQALDGTFGFFEMFDGKAKYPAAVEDSGERLDILESGLIFKQYPCCGGLHSLLDNIISLRQKQGIAPEQVDAIECRVHPQRIAYLDRPHVEEGLEAKFSIQYCVATALTHGKVGFTHFSKESVLQRETQALMKKVRITPTEDLGGFGSELIVRTSDGREFSSRLLEAKGSPNFPLTESELLQKFVDCAMMTMSASRAEKAGEALMSIETESNLGNIARWLCPK